MYDKSTDRWILKAREKDGVKVCLIDGEMITADIADRAKTICEALALRMVGGVETAEPIDFHQLRMSLERDPLLSKEQASKLAKLKCRLEKAQRKSRLGPANDSEAFVDLSKVVIYPKTAQDHRAEFVDLADAEWKSRIVEFCKQQEIKVLILDNLSTLNETLDDENSATSWNPLNTLVVALKKEGIATILVHHSNKQGIGFRGSSNISTTLETIVELKRLEKTKAAEGAAFRVRFEKSRSIGKPEADGKVLKLDAGRWVIEIDEVGMAAQVVDMIKSNRYGTQSENCRWVGCGSIYSVAPYDFGGQFGTSVSAQNWAPNLRKSKRPRSTLRRRIPRMTWTTKH